MSQAFARSERINILIIRRDNIGDLVCTTPLIAGVRARYPNATLRALVNSYNARVLEGNPCLDEICIYTKLKHVEGGFKKIYSLFAKIVMLSRLRFIRQDIVVLAKTGFDRHGLALAKQVGAKQVIGFNGEGKAPECYVPVRPVNYERLHEVECLAHLSLAIDVKDALGPLQIYPKGTDPVSNRQFIALHISAREKDRQWGAHNHISFIQWLLKAYPALKIALLWAPGVASDARHPGDDELACHILGQISSERLVGVPTESLSDLIDVLNRCSLFVGSDGGAMHVAAGLGLPIIGLFENRSEKLMHWYPWKVPSKVVHGVGAVSSISLDSVQSAFEVIWGRR